MMSVYQAKINNQKRNAKHNWLVMKTDLGKAKYLIRHYHARQRLVQV